MCMRRGFQGCRRGHRRLGRRSLVSQVEAEEYCQADALPVHNLNHRSHTSAAATSFIVANSPSVIASARMPVYGIQAHTADRSETHLGMNLK